MAYVIVKLLYFKLVLLSRLLDLLALKVVVPALSAHLLVVPAPEVRSFLLAASAILLACLSVWTQDSPVVLAVGAHQEADSILVEGVDLATTEQTREHPEVDDILWAQVLCTLAAATVLVSVHKPKCPTLLAPLRT